MKELEERGIDPCGEAEEFHTTVIDRPIFNKRIGVEEVEIVVNDKYKHLILKLKN